MTTKNVAVIGAGASGLTAIKCCLDEGMEPVCFEKSGDIGGLWQFRAEVSDDQGCVNKSTIINTSKEMMCYSDFPIPKEYPVFMHNKLVQKYFHQYADAFGLKEYIKFHSQVLHVSKTDDFEQSGRWEIETLDRSTKEKEKNIFDGVLVCTGHHASKNVPQFVGEEEFQGEVIHSQDYKDIKGYEDKRLVVVGIGNSGGDIATELSRVASQVFLSTRRGSWVLNRVAENGMPIDMLHTTRFKAFMKDRLPPSLVNWAAKRKMNQRFDHNIYSLTPKHEPFAQHPMVNDDLPNRLIAGSVKIKEDIKRFTKSGVEFVDGSYEDNIDSIILATGYVFGFPFIEKSVIDVKANDANLFKFAFPPDLEKSTLAVIGFIQPLGAIMPIAELQCRLACRLIKGDTSLPSRADMWDDIRKKKNEMSLRYVKSQRHTIQVDWVPFMDELAELNGCKPDFWSLLLSDPILALSTEFGPCTPYQYRLQGPGRWAEARQAILTQWDRTFYPLKTRSLRTSEHSSYTHLLLFVVCLAVVAYVIRLVFTG